MNYRDKGLKRLPDVDLAGQVERLVFVHKDRLLRFGAKLVFAICQAGEVEMVIINQGDEASFGVELASDGLEIITVFSARLDGSRSDKSQKLINDMHRAVQEAQC